MTAPVSIENMRFIATNQGASVDRDIFDNFIKQHEQEVRTQAFMDAETYRDSLNVLSRLSNILKGEVEEGIKDFPKLVEDTMTLLKTYGFPHPRDKTISEEEHRQKVSALHLAAQDQILKGKKK